MFKILRNIKNKNSNYSYTGIGRLGSLTEEKKRPLVLLKLLKNSYKCFVCHAVNAVAKCCVWFPHFKEIPRPFQSLQSTEISFGFCEQDFEGLRVTVWTDYLLVLFWDSH